MPFMIYNEEGSRYSLQSSAIEFEKVNSLNVHGRTRSGCRNLALASCVRRSLVLGPGSKLDSSKLGVDKTRVRIERTMSKGWFLRGSSALCRL